VTANLPVTVESNSAEHSEFPTIRNSVAKTQEHRNNESPRSA